MTAGALRQALTPRALAAWAGTDRLSALPFHLPSTTAPTDAGLLFSLLVAGNEVELETLDRARARARARDTWTCTLDELLESSDVEIADGRVRARVSILPLGPSLLVCDRLDAEGGTDLVCWPDDSSYHLAHAIPPGRRRRWLDVATGSAFAPLMRPELAEEILGTDVNTRAVAYARRGVELSAIGHIEVRQADLADGIDGTFDLVTCNAPIPADVGPLWRATADTAFFARLLESVPRVLAPGGLVVIHGALASLAPLVAELAGDRVVISYVPEGGKQFGIVWWEPTGETRQVLGYRELTPEQPHLTHADRSIVEPA
jgi:SAM-dependent methyltransferase